MKVAIIETGGKQYLVSEGSTIKIDKIKNISDPGNLTFKKVLLYADEENFLVGKPYLDNVSVEGELIKEFKVKTLIIKYKPKTRYRRKKGHKQLWWQVKIKKISLEK